jgi:hypothetical protein
MAEWLATCAVIAVGGFLFIRWTLKADQKAFDAIDRFISQERDWEVEDLLPETDSEVTVDNQEQTADHRTLIIEAQVSADVECGAHSMRRVIVRGNPYRGKHHSRIGCLTVAVLLAREEVAV